MIRSQHAHLYVAAASHAGLSGKNNEDCYAVTSYLLDRKTAIPTLLAVVADGIGGHCARNERCGKDSLTAWAQADRPSCR